MCLPDYAYAKQNLKGSAMVGGGKLSLFLWSYNKIWCLPDYAYDKQTVKGSTKVGGGKLSLFLKNQRSWKAASSTA